MKESFVFKTAYIGTKMAKALTSNVHDDIPSQLNIVVAIHTNSIKKCMQISFLCYKQPSRVAASTSSFSTAAASANIYIKLLSVYILKVKQARENLLTSTFMCCTIFI